MDNATLIDLGHAIEAAASDLTTQTIEAGPGGTGNALRVGLALMELQTAAQAYSDAYAAEVARAAA